MNAYQGEPYAAMFLATLSLTVFLLPSVQICYLL